MVGKVVRPLARTVLMDDRCFGINKLPKTDGSEFLFKSPGLTHHRRLMGSPCTYGDLI